VTLTVTGANETRDVLRRTILVRPLVNAAGTTVAVTPANTTAPTDSAVAVDIVARNRSTGLGSYDVTVRTPRDSAAATIRGVSTTNASELTDPLRIGPANHSVRISADVDRPLGTNGSDRPVTLATVVVAAPTTGTTPVTVDIDALRAPNGSVYDGVGVTNGSLRAVTPPGPIGQLTNPPQDLDRDGMLEDIDGNGDGEIFDAVAYYNNKDSDTLRTTPALFDFDGDGRVGTIFDAVALYNDITD
jgi:PKD repeat protein